MRYKRLRSSMHTARTSSRAKDSIKTPMPRRRRRRRLRLRNEAIFLLAAGIIILLLIILIISSLRPRNTYVKIQQSDFQALRIPYQSITNIHELSVKYNVSFSKLLTVFSLDNRFFPKDHEYSGDITAIETTYMLNYDRIDEKYPREQYADYYNVLEAVFSEIKKFPVISGFSGNDYMYGDSFGVKLAHGEKGIHYGTDISDRGNTRGRIGIVSMTDGYISDMGQNTSEGHFIVIKTQNGSEYLYSHFDSITTGLKKGDSVRAGQELGKMGGSGPDAAVRLHLGISVKTSAKKLMPVNPYIILRYAEWLYYQ